MKTYEVVFDKKKDKGVYALSCVENPAMEDIWLTLADHPQEIQFTAVDEDRRLLLGAALIPNKKIYRKVNDQEFNIVFSAETIEAAAHNFIKNGYQNNSSENHNVALSGVSVVQSWIVDNPELDKSKSYGKTYEKGTWVTLMEVDNDELWQKAKNGELNGFSIDGLFTLKEMNVELNNQSMDKKGILEAIREGFASIFSTTQLGSMKLKDGKTKIVFEGDQPELGMPVFLLSEDKEQIRMPKGKHELENGVFLNVDENGLVSEEEKEVEAPVEAPVEADVKKEVEELVAEMKAQYTAELARQKEVYEKQIKAEKAKVIELELKLEATPASDPIVKLSKDDVAAFEPKTAKERIFKTLLTVN